MNVSLAGVQQDSAAAPLVGTTASDPLAKPMPPDGIDQVWITIHRVALIPGSDGTVPDPSGETSVVDSGSPEAGHVNGDISPPEEVDLLDLPVGVGAHFLNTIDNVPAGTYGKIRLYYSDPEVHFVDAVGNTATHPTANYHLDIHFKGGDLVIPVTTGSEGGVIVHDVTVYFVQGKDGLKINVNPSKILMRPQVFATVGTVVQYVISGFADNVNILPETFDVITDGGRSFHTMFSLNDNVTKWAFKDNETKQQVALDNNLLGIAALRDGSLVDVYGMFTGIDTLFADNVVIIFTDWKQGLVAPGGEPPSGWQSDNTFGLNFPGDNVVTPMPLRTEARYDNNVDLDQTFTDNIITQGTSVRARGYADLTGVEAYWISIGP